MLDPLNLGTLDVSQIAGDDQALLELHYMILEEERRKGLEDLYYFDKYILGYKDMRPLTHKPVCMFASDKTKRKKHIELPRGNFKSSVVTIGYTLQRVAENPDIRILIDNEVYANSKAFLREIKGHMEDPRLLELYPQLEPNRRINDGWTESSIIVKARTKSLKEPTISCAGLDQIKVGMHYDLIIMDDLVSPRTCTTKEQMDKVVDHYKLALSLLDPGGELIIIGTRYHYSDLYGYLLENEPETFAHMIIPAILDEEAANFLNENYAATLGHIYHEGDLLFPERLTREFLQDQRTSQGTYIFNCQYMLKPVNSEEADFRREWLQYYKGYLSKSPEGKWLLTVEWVGDHEKRPIEGMSVPFTVEVKTFTTWDPANKKKKKSDFTGGSTVAIDNLSRWFVLNLNRDKYNPREIVDRILYEHDKYESEITGIEEVGKDTIKFYLLERMKKLNKFFRLKELKTGGVNKEDRIKRLIPRFENGMIFLPLSLQRKNWEGKTIDVVEWFENEYLYFPLAKTDDIIDALAYQEDLIPKPGKEKGQRRKGRARSVR
jgi:phage terminase large subunit-like protein